ncbi:MAG TPA: histidine kinase [Gemmatimonadaceae bacterium]|nr:histidine kinase [Gemmatimonadaceae bacterium]
MFLAPRFFGEWYPGEAAAAISGLTAGAIVSYLLYRFVRRVPWPRPFRIQFVFLHAAALVVFAASWIVLSIAIETLFTGNPMVTRTLWRLRELPAELPEISVLLYGVVVGIAYSMEKRARFAQAEAEAARARLAALRAQLHPHFLFNALHTVVQLIPIDADRAVEAAELVSSLLRVTVEENRDEIPLADEWNFVSRYLQMEQLRFGDRLRVRAQLDRDLFDEQVPSFALQTLVENAVRHGAANRVAPTEICITAARTDSKLKLSVWNEGEPLPANTAENGVGTGLSRLRDRLSFMYGDAAQLTTAAREVGGFEAILIVPRKDDA